MKSWFKAGFAATFGCCVAGLLARVGDKVFSVLANKGFFGKTVQEAMQETSDR